MNAKYKLYADRVLTEHNRYYFMRNVTMDVSIALEKAKNLQIFLNNQIKEEAEPINQCAICYESMDNKSTVKTNCNHTFCLDCVIKNKNNNKHTGKLCGICRSNICR
tara:strand:- start:456 stop:776 length:321 start_codon:yes stop_codon:yes gene_type:complete